MNYQKFIGENIISLDCSDRGGTLKVDVSGLFPYIDNAVVGAYQNYLGGGMLGAVMGASMFDPSELKITDRAKHFENLLLACKKYLHNATNHAGDEWESCTFSENQSRLVSAY